MNLVFSFDEGYAEVFKVLLHSLYLNNKETRFNIYLLHDEMLSEALEDLQRHIEWLGCQNLTGFFLFFDVKPV